MGDNSATPDFAQIAREVTPAGHTAVREALRKWFGVGYRAAHADVAGADAAGYNRGRADGIREGLLLALSFRSKSDLYWADKIRDALASPPTGGPAACHCDHADLAAGPYRERTCPIHGARPTESAPTGGCWCSCHLNGQVDETVGHCRSCESVPSAARCGTCPDCRGTGKAGR